MSYSPRNVQSQLKKAFERAKHQIENGLAKGNEKLEVDIGHEKALRGAENAPVIVNVKSVHHKDRLIQRGRFRYHWEERDPGDIFSQAKVWKIHVQDRRPYPLFLLRSRLYLVLRGIPHRLKHKTARAKFKRNMSIRKSLMITEEALQWAGILLQNRDYDKRVSKAQGAIHTPWTGKVEKAINPPPSNGGRIVRAGDVLFVIRVWTKPSVSELSKIKTPVGGSVESVAVKVGDMVDKGQLLVQLESPFASTSPF
jgi:biotin carboxyl carrier protein